VPLNLPEPAQRHFPHSLLVLLPNLGDSVYFDGLSGVMRSRDCSKFVFIDDLNLDLRYDLSKGHAALPEETPIAPTGETPPTAAMTATPTATPATGA